MLGWVKVSRMGTVLLMVVVIGDDEDNGTTEKVATVLYEHG